MMNLRDNQFVQLFNKRRRGEMRNIGEIEMMPVVGDDVLTSRFFGTLVLQHILEVFYWGSYGSHHLLFAKINNLNKVRRTSLPVFYP